MKSGKEKSEMQFDEFKKYHAIRCRIMMENDIGILSLLLEQIIAHVEEKTNFSLFFLMTTSKRNIKAPEESHLFSQSYI